MPNKKSAPAAGSPAPRRKRRQEPPPVKSKLETEARYRDFIDHLPVMFYAVEPEPPFAPIYVNPAFAALGYPLADWVAQPDLWRRVIHPDDAAEVVAKTEAARRAGTETDFEYRIVKRDGSLCWVRDRGCFVRDERGAIVCRQGVILDVTPRVAAIEALRDSEERYRDLFENANDLIYVVDLEGNVLALNEATVRTFGYTREEAVRLNLRHVVVPEQLELAVSKRAEKLDAGVKQTAYEIDCLDKNGARLTLEVNTSIIYKKGAPVAVQCIARDVTERKLTEKARRESEERYRDLFENANDLIYTHDLDGNFTSLNRAGELISGYTREEALRMNISEVVAPEHLAAARRMTQRKLADGAPVAYETEIIAKNGQRVPLELSTRLIFQNGAPVGVQGIARDIAERRRARQALEESERGYRYLSEGIMHQVWTARPDGALDYVNRRTAEYFGLAAEQLIGHGWQHVIHPDDLAECGRRWSHSLATGDDYEIEFRLRSREGEYRWHLGRAKAGRDVAGRIVRWYGTNTDVHDQKAAEAKLNHYAKHDALTNLANRAEFMNHLRTAVERLRRDAAGRFAVLFLDLDRFKLVNDSLGHAVGDKLLIAIGERLQACARQRDTVARLGGDEFTVLLSDIGDQAQALQVAERIQESFARPFMIDSYEIFASASIGVIVSDETHRQPEDFLRDADTAMYRAKEAGKARCEVFDREMHVRNLNLLRVETDLRRAIERREFRVFYQPVVDLASGEIREFEALVRWQHPEFGLVAPAEFINVAEETGLIIPIGEWVLAEACRQIAEWQRLKRDGELAVSVNLSAKQLMHPRFVEHVGRLLRETGLKPRSLQLEVTETTVMEHSEPALRILRALNALGVELSTDDFGTGYSSLSYLHRFPFKRLKIDRSFIGKMETDAKSEAIIRTILTLADNLKLEAVAEGIENTAQLAALRRLGCRLGQGFFVSEPVAPAHAARLLGEGCAAGLFAARREAPPALESDAIIELVKVQ